MKSYEEIKKIDLVHKPTPLYKLNNISHITGKNIYIKRDDMTGIGLGERFANLNMCLQML